MAAIGGRDTSIFLFRALGKILYCKSKPYFTILFTYWSGGQHGTIGGRDTSIFLFRVFGKILYCKSKPYFIILFTNLSGGQHGSSRRKRYLYLPL